MTAGAAITGAAEPQAPQPPSMTAGAAITGAAVPQAPQPPVTAGTVTGTVMVFGTRVQTW